MLVDHSCTRAIKLVEQPVKVSFIELVSFLNNLTHLDQSISNKLTHLFFVEALFIIRLGTLIHVALLHPIFLKDLLYDYVVNHVVADTIFIQNLLNCRLLFLSLSLRILLFFLRTAITSVRMHFVTRLL